MMLLDGVPETTPVEGLRFKPMRSDPDTIEIVESLVRVGVREKENPLLMMRLV